MQTEKQLTTSQNKINPYLNDSKLKVWVVTVGIEKHYLTGTQLQFYKKAKEAGATQCDFGDFGLSTNYQSYKLDWDEVEDIKKKERMEANQKKFESY